MQIRELLDDLLTSLETGPLITAVRHFDAKPAVFRPSLLGAKGSVSTAIAL